MSISNDVLTAEKFISSLEVDNLKENLDNLFSFCKEESENNLYLEYEMNLDTKFPYLSVVLMRNDSEYILALRSIHEACDVKDFFEEMTADIKGSIERGYKMPKPRHKPLFSYEEIVGTIIRNNLKKY